MGNGVESTFISMNAQKLLPQISTQTAIERRLAARVLKLNPGLGEKSLEIANSLADSGITTAAAVMLLQAVYSPTDPIGRGQGTRAKWFVETVRRRYSYKLDKIRNDPKYFRTFVSDMEEVVEMRDILNGEGIVITFESAFLLWELGLNADSVMSIIQEVCDFAGYPRLAAQMVVKAARAVKAGHFMELETAIESMRYGYSSDQSN